MSDWYCEPPNISSPQELEGADLEELAAEALEQRLEGADRAEHLADVAPERLHALEILLEHLVARPALAVLVGEIDRLDERPFRAVVHERPHHLIDHVT